MPRLSSCDITLYGRAPQIYKGAGLVIEQQMGPPLFILINEEFESNRYIFLGYLVQHSYRVS